jgi:hypothetical protein
MTIDTYNTLCRESLLAKARPCAIASDSRSWNVLAGKHPLPPADLPAYLTGRPLRKAFSTRAKIQFKDERMIR